MISFQQLLEDSLLTTSVPTSDNDLYYSVDITEEELAQLRLAFETRLAVQHGTN